MTKPSASRNHDRHGRAKRSAIAAWHEGTGLTEAMDKLRTKVYGEMSDESGHTEAAQESSGPPATDTRGNSVPVDDGASQPEADVTADDCASASTILRSSAPDQPGVMAIAGKLDKAGQEMRNDASTGDSSDSGTDTSGVRGDQPGQSVDPNAVH